MISKMLKKKHLTFEKIAVTKPTYTINYKRIEEDDFKTKQKKIQLRAAIQCIVLH